MKKAMLALITVCMVLLMAATASAARPAPIGAQIDVFNGVPDVFPAGTPFHVIHGWGPDPTEGYPLGLFSFELEIDGEPVASDAMLMERGDEEYPLLRRWLYNFPDGMLGVHEFTGHWFAPCLWAVDNGHYPGPCRNRGEVVEAWTASLEVTFTE